VNEITDIAEDPSVRPLPDGPPPEPPPGPIAQSVAIGFRAVYAVTLLLAVVWLGTNIRQIAPDNQAVVMRLGRIVKVQNSGLLLAWPRPIEEVLLLPGPERQLSETVGSLPPVGGIAAESAGNGVTEEKIPATASLYLTGDGNVVFLDAKLTYHIVDPRAYVLSQVHIQPGLDRMFRAAAVRVTAGYGLNDFLVAQPNAVGGAGAQSITALRTAVRDDLLSGVNGKLQELNKEGVGFGIQVDRIDLTAWLPPEAKTAFDAVLTATQVADQQVAAARTAAELRRQGAEREGDRVTSAAQATASEGITSASVNTAPIKALAAQETTQNKGTVMLRAYNERIPSIMNSAGSVTLVDPQGGSRFVLPGK
jgi:regulator of protease activity HflC (stomatin/prohibitin superfamily)